jgi:hypothetical protein
MKDGQGNLRHPSELAMDAADSSFTKATRSRIGELSQSYFQLELHPEEKLGPRLEKLKRDKDEFDEKYADLRTQIQLEREQLAAQERFLAPEDAAARRNEIKNKEDHIRKEEGPITAERQYLDAIRENRKDAFFLSRSALLKDKKSSYWEQFEGLYALMRGTTAALAMASAYSFGWGTALMSGAPGSWNRWIIALVFFLLVIILVHSAELGRKHERGARETERERREQEEITLHAFRISVLALGFCAGILVEGNIKHDQVDFNKVQATIWMVLIGFAWVIAALRCHGAYKAFAREFALAVWRDFANIEKRPEPAHLFINLE